MREKLSTLPLAELKELAKTQGIKGASTMRKSEIIDALCQAAETAEIVRTAVAPPKPVDRSTSQETRQDGRPARPARTERPQPESLTPQEIAELDSGIEANGILEVMPDGFGFIRCENFLPGENDVYVAPSQIRRFNLKTGDIVKGSRRIKTATEKFAALLYIKSVNGYPISVIERRPNFEDLTPIFPNQRLHMETPGKSTTAMRVLDLLSPIGKGQRV